MPKSYKFLPFCLKYYIFDSIWADKGSDLYPKNRSAVN